jgi:hypothetical protein
MGEPVKPFMTPQRREALRDFAKRMRAAADEKSAILTAQSGITNGKISDPFMESVAAFAEALIADEPPIIRTWHFEVDPKPKPLETSSYYFDKSGEIRNDGSTKAVHIQWIDEPEITSADDDKCEHCGECLSDCGCTLRDMGIETMSVEVPDEFEAAEILSVEEARAKINASFEGRLEGRLEDGEQFFRSEPFPEGVPIDLLETRTAPIFRKYAAVHESHPLESVFADVIAQCTKGKGVRHGGEATPFLEQPWAHYAKLHGRGFLTGQAAKKLEEAASTRHGQAFIDEALGAIVYIGMAVLREREIMERAAKAGVEL